MEQIVILYLSNDDYESLKRKLYDRLKQGCFRLGYRPNKTGPTVKHISCLQQSGDFSRLVDQSESSILTERTNSAKSDMFYAVDGQWRSVDWSYVGATTTVKKQNTTTVIRRRQLCVTPPEDLSDEIQARISESGHTSIISTALPWFVPWVFTILMLILTQKPTPSQLNKRRKQQNLRKVRSEQYRSPPRKSRITRTMRPVLPTNGSSLLLLAKSLPTQTRRSSTDGTIKTQMLSKQLAAVARVSRMPVTGLPQRPRLIMTPPSSPITSPRSFESMKKAASEPVTPIPPMEFGNPGRSGIQQQFRIIEESPRKLVVEIEKGEQLEGLLSQHFANTQRDRLDSPVSSGLRNKEKEDCCHHDASYKQQGQLVTCIGKTTENMTSEPTAEQNPIPDNSSQPIPSRKAQTINMLKARKREMARSRDSQGSIDTVIGSAEAQRMEALDRPRTPTDADVLPSSLSGSLTEDFFCEQLEKQRASGPQRSDSGVTCCSSASSFGLDSELPSLSKQTYELIRVNSRVLGKDLSGSFTNQPNRWSSINEETSAELTEAAVLPPLKTTNTDHNDKQNQLSKLTALEMWNPAVKPCTPKKTVSPFAHPDQQPSTPKPQRPQPANNLSDKETRQPKSKDKALSEESITEPRESLPKKPPPPPPQHNKKQRSLKIATNRPPPPSKSASKAGKGPAPPPPPPGSKRGKGKNDNGYTRSNEVIRIFQEVRKISKKGSFQPRSHHVKSTSDASTMSSQGSGGDALIKELEKTSSHFAQIQADVETRGPVITQMIHDINTIKFETMSELSSFVKRTDAVLETFADETAVLKHFDWPHKYYIYREALALWLELRSRTDMCHKWVQGPRGISAELNRMKKHMELNLRRLDEVKRTLDVEEKKFLRNGIPWDSSVLQKVNDGTMLLLEKYMQIVCDEVERTQSKSAHRERNLQFLTDTINLTFKIHQFVGGLAESCATLFERIASYTRKLTNM